MTIKNFPGGRREAANPNAPKLTAEQKLAIREAQLGIAETSGQLMQLQTQAQQTATARQECIAEFKKLIAESAVEGWEIDLATLEFKPSQKPAEMPQTEGSNAAQSQEGGSSPAEPASQPGAEPAAAAHD